MTTRSAISWAAIATLALSTSLYAQRATGDSFTWQGAMQSGSTLVIRNVNGPVTVQRASGNQAEVVAEKHYTRGDPNRVIIEAVRFGSGNANAVVCGLWGGGADAKCTERGSLTVGREPADERSDVAVHFTVKLPAGVKARLETVNGNVTLTGASSDVQASTVNGNVNVNSAGAIVASTVNGSVEATIAAASIPGDIDLKTVNGSVTATAPSALNARFSASTVTGGIESDFPMNVQGRFFNRSVNATLGSGGKNLSMTTVNGSVVLRKN
jgi:hypothetical protein